MSNHAGEFECMYRYDCANGLVLPHTLTTGTKSTQLNESLSLFYNFVHIPLYSYILLKYNTRLCWLPIAVCIKNHAIFFVIVGLSHTSYLFVIIVTCVILSYQRILLLFFYIICRTTNISYRRLNQIHNSE